jgi:hypothetical protein
MKYILATTALGIIVNALSCSSSLGSRQKMEISGRFKPLGNDLILKPNLPGF